MNNLLRVNGLDAWYGQAKVLFGVDLEVGEHEVVGIVGHNGAGKSTLLRTISRLHRRSRGTISLGDRRLDTCEPYQAARLGVSQVREGSRILEQMTVDEQLRLARRLATRTHRAGRTLDEIYDLFPILRGHRRTKGGYLSGGQRQALALAGAFATAPRVMLLDEPSTGLAPTVTAQVFAIIAQVAASGVALVVAEQKPALLESVAQRTYQLQMGRLTLQPQPSGNGGGGPEAQPEGV